MVCEVSSSSSHSGVGQQFGRESSVSSVGLGGSSARSLLFHNDSSLADWNHLFRVPQLDMLESRIWRDRTVEFRVVVCSLLVGQGSLIQQDNILSVCVDLLRVDNPRF
eukprot:scaffold481_cov63-Attheya_sp.AAC.8